MLHLRVWPQNKGESSNLEDDALRDLVSVTIWRLYGHSNVCECMLTLFSTFMPFLSVCMSYGILTGLLNANFRMPIKRVNTSNLMTFEWCFLISKYHENCNVILHCITSCIFEHSYLHCSSMFSLDFYSFYLLFTIFVSDVAENKQS